MISMALLRLTHFPLYKMAVISADDIFKWIFLNENDRIPIKTSLKFVRRIDNEPILLGHKPLPELVIIQITDTYMRH